MAGRQRAAGGPPLTQEQLKCMAASLHPTYSFSYNKTDGKLDAVILAQPIAGTNGEKKLIFALPHEHVLHLAEEVKKRLAQPPRPVVAPPPVTPPPTPPNGGGADPFTFSP